ncbi:MAG: helix-turn-helix domain-containing protein [Candidatus Cryptobacteroides sp.]
MGFYEALAHELRGATFMFFLLWSVNLFRYRKRNNMMFVLFVTTICLSIGFLKDSVFLFDCFKNSIFTDSIVSIIDFSVMLVSCNFFREAVKPDSSRSPLVWLLPLSVLFFIPAYVAFHDERIVKAAFIYSLVISSFTIIYMVVFAVRHSKYLSDNYSYVGHMGIRWVVLSGIVYLSCMLLYAFLFRDPTWISEIVYCIISVSIWSYILVTARIHRVVRRIDSPNIETSQDQPENTEDVPELENLRSITEIIEPKLKECMETGKLYLNPGLSLKNVAMEIGSNTKYLSLYLNHSLGITFYDYINSFRVQEACRIFEGMVDTGRLNMDEVAAKSGFNSVSSFNRYFRKVTGITPKEYYKSCMKDLSV